MEVQSDYETALTLAVCPSPGKAAAAVRRLRAVGLPADAITRLPLAPGRYQLSDETPGPVVRGATRGVAVGAPIGALVGLGVAALVPGIGPVATTGLAAAGALGGMLVGGLTGATAETRFDDDVAGVINVPPGSRWLLLIIRTSSAPGRDHRARAREAVLRAGAVAFLDPTTVRQVGDRAEAVRPEPAPLVPAMPRQAPRPPQPAAPRAASARPLLGRQLYRVVRMQPLVGEGRADERTQAVAGAHDSASGPTMQAARGLEGTTLRLEELAGMGRLCWLDDHTARLDTASESYRVELEPAQR